MVEPEPIGGFMRNNDGVHLIAGSALTRENPTGEQLVYRPRPVLIHARDLDEAVIDALADRFGFQDPRLSTAPLVGDVLQTPLIGFDGNTVA